MSSEDGITVRQNLQITSATKSANSRHPASWSKWQKRPPTEAAYPVRGCLRAKLPIKR